MKMIATEQCKRLLKTLHAAVLLKVAKISRTFFTSRCMCLLIHTYDYCNKLIQSAEIYLLKIKDDGANENLY